MTSKEILQASFLEILFEHRNKEYGAYALRKFYNNRLGIALAFSLSAVLLFLIIFGSFNTGKELTIEDPIVTVSPPIEITPIHNDPVEPIQKQQIKAATIDNAIIRIVTDAEVKQTEVPDIDFIGDKQIGLENIEAPVIEAAISTPSNVSSNGQDVAHAVAAPPFDPLEVQPQFPGGAEAWAAFLSRYLRVPDEIQGGERKTVLVKFIVAEDGKVTAFEVVQSGGAAFDNEVIRVLKKMPQWKPAIQNGQNVKAMFTQPVTFQSVEE